MKRNKGFSLIEVVVVLAMMAILAAITFPSITGYVEDSKNESYISDAKMVYKSAALLDAKYIARSENAGKTASQIASFIKAKSDTIIDDASIDDNYSDSSTQKAAILRVSLSDDMKINEMWYRATKDFQIFASNTTMTKYVHYTKADGFTIDKYPYILDDLANTIYNGIWNDTTTAVTDPFDKSYNKSTMNEYLYNYFTKHNGYLDSTGARGIVINQLLKNNGIDLTNVSWVIQCDKNKKLYSLTVTDKKLGADDVGQIVDCIQYVFSDRTYSTITDTKKGTCKVITKSVDMPGKTYGSVIHNNLIYSLDVASFTETK